MSVQQPQSRVLPPRRPSSAAVRKGKARQGLEDVSDDFAAFLEESEDEDEQDALEAAYQASKQKEEETKQKASKYELPSERRKREEREKKLAKRRSKQNFGGDDDDEQQQQPVDPWSDPNASLEDRILNNVLKGVCEPVECAEHVIDLITADAAKKGEFEVHLREMEERMADEWEKDKQFAASLKSADNNEWQGMLRKELGKDSDRHGLLPEDNLREMYVPRMAPGNAFAANATGVGAAGSVPSYGRRVNTNSGASTLHYSTDSAALPTLQTQTGSGARMQRFGEQAMYGSLHGARDVVGEGTWSVKETLRGANPTPTPTTPGAPPRHGRRAG
ncbi:hypothetical protein RI054_27g113550 [Pseudoscourfieldia marina]